MLELLQKNLLLLFLFHGACIGAGCLALLALAGLRYSGSAPLSRLVNPPLRVPFFGVLRHILRLAVVIHSVEYSRTLPRYFLGKAQPVQRTNSQKTTAFIFAPRSVYLGGLPCVFYLCIF